MNYDITSQSGFERTYREYFPKIYNYIFYRLLSREDTEDVVSVIFMKAARSAETFDESRASLRTWLCRIAQNALIDFFLCEEADGLSRRRNCRSRPAGRF